MKITRIDAFRHKLGEGPLWDPLEQALYGVDVLGRSVWRYDPRDGDYECWAAGEIVSALALRTQGGAVVACGDRLKFLDFGSGRFTSATQAFSADRRLQLNDGKVDAAGRFVVGEVNTTGPEALASFFAVELDLVPRRVEAQFAVSNGPCWSPDSRVFYCADTVSAEIFACDYDLASGRTSGRRRFASTAALGGGPDGATVDAQGCLWTALCGGGKVVRYAPDGAVLTVVELPTSLVSSVMFGGPDLDRLFVTTIDGAAAAAEIPLAAANPVPHDENSGALFIIDGLGVTGLPEPRFAG